MRHNPCPRCGGQLIGWKHSDITCLQCGYVVDLRSLWTADLVGREIDLESEAEQEPSEEREPRTSE